MYITKTRKRKREELIDMLRRDGFARYWLGARGDEFLFAS
jgi:hypothetical protein